MDKIALSHPGKIGDSLYTIPIIRYLAERWNCKVDFYTSEYVEPARSLFEYQSCIDSFVVPHGYKIQSMDMGIQPYVMPVNLGEYEIVYHLGFRKVPETRLDHWMAASVGIDPSSLPRVYYEFPEWVWTEEDKRNYLKIPEKYYVLAPRGYTSYRDTFRKFINISDLPVIQIGGKGEVIHEDLNTLEFDFTGLDFLKTLSVLSKASGFVGLMSSQLVLANGFDFPKVAPHNNQSWDMRHVVYSDTNFYPVNPTAEQILTILRG